MTDRPRGGTPPSGIPGGDTPGITPPSGIPGGDTPPSRIPGGDTPPFGILESVLYARDLVATESFYRDVLGLAPYARLRGRHLFYRCGQQMLLIFNPDATRLAPACGALPVPAHGAEGAGHLCFAASTGEIAAWRERLTARGVSIEADFAWPGGGRSLYFRDPAGNSLEFAEPRIWNLPWRAS